jgi:hypothetical protein
MKLNLNDQNKDLIILILGIGILFLLSCNKENFSAGKENAKSMRKDKQLDHERKMQAGAADTKAAQKPVIISVGFAAGSMVCFFILMIMGMGLAAQKSG